jgi:hypothetical protein
MNKELAGRRAVICGASGGIGAAAVRGFLDRGRPLPQSTTRLLPWPTWSMLPTGIDATSRVRRTSTRRSIELPRIWAESML